MWKTIFLFCPFFLHGIFALKNFQENFPQFKMTTQNFRPVSVPGQKYGSVGATSTELGLAKSVNSGSTNPLGHLQLSNDLDKWEAPYEIRRNYPYYHSGYDEDMRPILVMEIGKWNYRKIIEAGGDTLKIFEKYLDQAFYRLNKFTKEGEVQGAQKGVIALIDFEDFNMSQMADLPTVTQLLQWSRKYRPILMENLYLGIGINVNAVGHSLITLLRPTLGSIMEKALVFGTNKAKWIPQVLKHCPRSQIPEWYGGTKNFQPVRIYG